MRTLWILLSLISAVFWAGWYYLAALGCGFGNGSQCGAFQGNLDMTITVFWMPLGVFALLFFAVWLIFGRGNR
jgi:hypothetical protein